MSELCLKMGLITALFGKKTPNRVNHIFTEQDRELSAEVRKLKAKQKIMREQLELKKLQYEIEELEDQYEPEEEEKDEIDGLLKSFLMPILQNRLSAGNPSSPEVASNVDVTPRKLTLNDEEIRQQLEAIPKSYRKKLKSMDNDGLRSLMLSVVPGLSEQTVTKAITIFKEEYT